MMPPPWAFTSLPSVSLNAMPGGSGGEMSVFPTGSENVPVTEPAATVQEPFPCPPLPITPPLAGRPPAAQPPVAGMPPWPAPPLPQAPADAVVPPEDTPPLPLRPPVPAPPLATPPLPTTPPVPARPPEPPCSPPLAELPPEPMPLVPPDPDAPPLGAPPLPVDAPVFVPQAASARHIIQIARRMNKRQLSAKCLLGTSVKETNRSGRPRDRASWPPGCR